MIFKEPQAFPVFHPLLPLFNSPSHTQTHTHSHTHPSPQVNLQTKRSDEEEGRKSKHGYAEGNENVDDDDGAAEEEEVTGKPVPRLIVSLYVNLIAACPCALTQVNAAVDANSLPADITCVQLLQSQYMHRKHSEMPLHIFTLR